jgi:hypothetical protein
MFGQRVMLVLVAVMIGLWIASMSHDADSGVRNGVAIAGFVAKVATIGFSWALTKSVLAARRSRT